MFDLLGDKGYREYSRDQYFSEYVEQAITELVKNGYRIKKCGMCNKYFLVITYTSQDGAESFLAFWGTSLERGAFIDLKMNFQTGGATINL